MRRLTKRIPNPDGANIVVYTMGDYEDTTAGEMSDGGIRIVLSALANYEDSDEQGLLLKLPCKVGDMVYRISTNLHTRIKKIEKTKISRIAIDENGIVFFCECNRVSKCIFGRTVFLTKAEAEKALKRMEGGV